MVARRRSTGASADGSLGMGDGRARAPFVPMFARARLALHNATIMSGPTACGYILEGMVELVRRAIEEARSMRREYADVLAQMTERERNLVLNRQRMRNARIERIAADRKDAARV